VHSELMIESVLTGVERRVELVLTTSKVMDLIREESVVGGGGGGDGVSHGRRRQRWVKEGGVGSEW
jgi:hypothetical protein